MASTGYGALRPYVVPEALEELAGPTEGVIMLPRTGAHERRPSQAYGCLPAARQRAETLDSPILLPVIATREAVASDQMGDHALAQGELARATRLHETQEPNRHLVTLTGSRFTFTWLVSSDAG